jgi:PilZ domain
MISSGLLGREVSLFGTDAAGKPFSDAAHAVSINGSEITLEGVKCALRVNLLVGIGYAGQEGLFRVAWVGDEGSPQHGRVGLRELQPEKKVLRSMTTTLALDRMAGNTTLVLEEERRPEPAPDRRRFPRIQCDGDVLFRRDGADTFDSGELKYLSEDGCYVQTHNTAPSLSEVVLSVKVEDLEVEAIGQVHGLQPGFGMGLNFLVMTPDQRGRLQQWVSRHRKE